MKTVQELYDAYRIMPGLQLHQLRMAAVAKTLCDNSTREIDEHAVLLACLFHDMGNIIKSDLTIFPEFLEPEGESHWRLVQRDFIQKYGEDTHVANVRIAHEIGLPSAAISLIDGIGFSRLVQIAERGSFEQMLCEYGDLRTGPHGVLSLDGRAYEGRERYKGRPGHAVSESEERFTVLLAAAHEVEKKVFAEATIAPDDITEQSVRGLFPELREYKVA
jgi:hypothetical protein